MKYGTHATKMNISKAVLSSAGRLASLESKTQSEQHRIAIQALMQEMTAIDATSFTAPPEPVIDQDEAS
jgi:hypothetical protein